MHTGHYISGGGHLALIGWLIFGDVFAAEPLPFEASSVSVISGAEYAAMVAAGPSPQSTTEVAQPSSPALSPDAPEIAASQDAVSDQTQPQQAQAPSNEDVPEVAETAALPQAEVSDQAPVLPDPPADVAVLVPETSDTPVPQAAERVAPEAVAQPDLEAVPDPVEQQAVTPDQAGETPRDPVEATAPEAAATEIVTEAEEPNAARAPTIRPPSRRPDPPVEQVAQPSEPAEPTAPAEDTPQDAVASALAEALAAESSAPAVPQGPPLSAGEKDALRVAVSSCWNVGSLSTDALNTTVVVAVSMTQDGKPVTASIRMASSSGGSAQAAGQAFEAARRAIIRCGAKGFELPVEKYSQWQDIEMTFNPERMRIK